MRDNERGGGGGGSGEGVNAARALGADTIGGLWSSPEEEGDGDLGCMGWCASQPRLSSKGVVPMTTGLMNTLKRRMRAYDTAALMKVNMTRSSIVCTSNIVYGSGKLCGAFSGLWVRKKEMREETTHIERPASQIKVQIGS